MGFSVTARKSSSEKIPVIIVVAGPEDFLVNEKLEELVRQHVSEESRAFDYTEFRSNDVDARTFWNALITMPFMAARRVVVLHVQGEPREDLQKALSQYAAQPAKTTLLIMVQVTDGAAAIKSSANVEVIPCNLLKRTSERAQWAREYAKRFGKELSAEAAEYLVTTSQTRLADLAAKLDHAILYVGDASGITGQDLLKVAGVSTEYLPWDLEDAILKRHPKEILKIVRSMKEGGEELLRIMAYQRGWLLQLWQVASVVKRTGHGKSDQEGQDSKEGQISTILGRKSWKSRDFEAAGAAIGLTRLRQAVVDLVDLEARLKTGRADWPGYYEWLWRLSQPR